MTCIVQFFTIVLAEWHWIQDNSYSGYAPHYSLPHMPVPFSNNDNNDNNENNNSNKNNRNNNNFSNNNNTNKS